MQGVKGTAQSELFQKRDLAVLLFTIHGGGVTYIKLREGENSFLGEQQEGRNGTLGHLVP